MFLRWAGGPMKSVNVACSVGTKNALVGEGGVAVEVRQMELVWSLKRYNGGLVSGHGLRLGDAFWRQDGLNFLIRVFDGGRWSTAAKIILGFLHRGG